MKLYSHPVLKFRTQDRLQISKEPGLLSWAALFLISSLGIVVDYYIIPDYFLIHTGFLLLCLILSLNVMKTWDLIMDREENLGTMIYRNWYHIFSVRVPEENVERFPLSAISSVIVTSDPAIEICRKDGSLTKITSKSSNFSSLKNLCREISSFLCLDRMECLRDAERIFYECDLEPWINSSGHSDNQESDNEVQDNNSVQDESQPRFHSNIKFISGVL